MARRQQHEILPEFPHVPDGIENPLTSEITSAFVAINGSGYGEEQQTVQFIRAYLLTVAQWQYLTSYFLSIADVLNGRYTGLHEPTIHTFFADWNTKLGSKQFGS